MQKIVYMWQTNRHLDYLYPFNLGTKIGTYPWMQCSVLIDHEKSKVCTSKRVFLQFHMRINQTVPEPDCKKDINKELIWVTAIAPLFE